MVWWIGLLLGSQASAGSEDALWLRGGMVWDGTGSEARAADVLVLGDRIVGVGTELPVPEGAREVDISGHTLLPGLIDSHVHVTSVPGSFYRGESHLERYELVRTQLRAYVASGVTTVLDCAIAHQEAEAIWGWMAAGHPGPELRVLGIPISPPDGYIKTILDVAPTFDTPEAISAHLDELVRLGAVGVKLPMEEGFVFRIWPLHTPSMLDHIRLAAAERDLPIYVHGMSNREFQISLDLGVHAMVHPPTHPSGAVVRRLASSGTWVVSTISIYDMFDVPNRPERMNHPLAQLTVPEPVMQTAQDPGAREAYRGEVLRRMIPKLAKTFGGIAEKQLDEPKPVQRRVRSLAKAVGKLHEGGVRVVMGSDAGNWPQLPYSFHGTVTLREVELLGMAGLTPSEALLASTSAPAEMLGISDEVGRVVPGLRADMMIVKGDPLSDLSALWEVAWTVRAGVIRTPAAWMERPDIPAPPPVLPMLPDKIGVSRDELSGVSP